MRPLTRLSIVLVTGLFAACSSSTGGDQQQILPDDDQNPPLQKLFTASDYLYEPVPADRMKGADNYTAKVSTIHGANEFHYTGKDCLRCHATGQKARAIPFSMAGTVYKDILGTEPLAGAEVVILDSAGKVISMSTNAAGNFMTQTQIADANPDPAKTERTYKTWVLGPDGKVLPMVTMTSGSCNMHHTPFNRRGAMWAGSWSAAATDAAQAIAANDTTFQFSYTKHVAPIFAAKCVPCHVPAPDAEKNLKEPLKGTTAVYDYTGGFDLVQYDSFIDDEAHPIESRTAPSGRKYVILGDDDPATAHDDREDSLILAKMLAPETSHGGGKLAADRNDVDYQVILRWIKQGAPGPVHAD